MSQSADMNSLEQLKNSNPFKMPQGYLEGLEHSVLEQIAGEGSAKPHFWRSAVKPLIYMAAMFGVIFGMGYGVMALTHTSERLPSTDASRVAEVEHGFLDASFIEFLDVSALDDNSSAEALSDDEILSYLSNELSINELATYLAQE